MAARPIRTLLQVQWRKSRWTLLAVAPGAVLAAFLIRVLGEVGVHPDYLQILTYAALLVSLIIPMFTILVIHSDFEKLSAAIPKRIFRLPLASWKIVAVFMGFGVVAVGVTALVTTLLLKYMLAPDFSWWGPPAGAVFATCALLVWAYAQSESAPRAAVISFLVFFVAVLIVLSWEGAAEVVETVTPPAAIAVVVAVFYALAVAGFSINRHGGFSEFPALTIFQRTTIQPAGILPTRFRSPHAAQRWYEWRQFGWQAPACVVAILFLFFLLMPLLAMVFEVKPAPNSQLLGEQARARDIDWFTSVQFVTTGLQVSAVVGAVVVGGYMFMSAGYWNPKATYLHTRPMSTRAMATARLRTMLKSVAMSLVILMAAAGAIKAYTLYRGEPIEMYRFMRQGYGDVKAWQVLSFYWGALFLIMWSAVWSVNLGWAFIALGATLFPAMGISTLMGSEQALISPLATTVTPAMQWGSWIGSAILAAGLLFAFVQGIRSGAVDYRAVAIAAGAWCVYVYAFSQLDDYYSLPAGANLLGEQFPHPIDWGLWAALSLIPVAPVFTHPWLLQRARAR